MITTEQAIRKIRGGGCDWLLAVYDEGQAFECGLCGHRERGFKDGAAAGREHLEREHPGAVAEVLSLPDEDPDDATLGRIGDALREDEVDAKSGAMCFECMWCKFLILPEPTPAPNTPGALSVAFLPRPTTNRRRDS